MDSQLFEQHSPKRPLILHYYALLPVSYIRCPSVHGLVSPLCFVLFYLPVIVQSHTALLCMLYYTSWYLDEQIFPLYCSSRVSWQLLTSCIFYINFRKGLSSSTNEMPLLNQKNKKTKDKNTCWNFDRNWT